MRFRKVTALLAAIPKSPEYSPTRNLQKAEMRRNIVLDQMAKYGYITAAEASAAKAKPIKLADKDCRTRRVGLKGEFRFVAAADRFEPHGALVRNVAGAMDFKPQRLPIGTLQWIAVAALVRSFKLLVVDDDAID